MKRIFILTLIISAITSCVNKSVKENNQNITKPVSIKLENAMYMLVGTYTSTDSKGIYVYKIDTISGKSEYVSEVTVENPSYLVLDSSEHYVYSVTENESDQTASANAFSFDKATGKLTFLNKQLTGGGAPCYINIDKEGKHVLTANYLGASITVFPVTKNGNLEAPSQLIRFSGKGIDPDRQKQPYIHCVQYSPDGKILFADDLGTDKIHRLEVMTNSDTAYLKAATPEFIKIKDGSGPRHLVFHPNGKYAYLITELSGDVIAFNYQNDNLTEFQTIKADTLNARGGGDIHLSPDGKFLYASNRLKGDGIAIFSVDQSNGRLIKIGYQTTGIHPRNFAITPNGKFLLVANRDSNNIQIFKRDQNTGMLTDTKQDINLSMPVCIKFASIK